MSGVRQSKITKWTVLAGLGEKGLSRISVNISSSSKKTALKSFIIGTDTFVLRPTATENPHGNLSTCLLYLFLKSRFGIEFDSKTFVILLSNAIMLDKFICQSNASGWERVIAVKLEIETVS